MTQLARRTRSSSSDGGFMYVEVLVSMVLLSFALLSLAPMYVLAGRENAAARDQTFGTAVAHDVAETLKRLPYDALESGADELKVGGMSYERSWTVVDDTPHPGLRTVTVRVVPQRAGGHGGPRIVEFSFYRTRT